MIIISTVKQRPNDIVGEIGHAFPKSLYENVTVSA
jgi:hypothetical protein